MKFIHIGDVHLGMSFKSASFGKRFGQKKREAIKDNLIKVLKSCKSKKIDLVLFAGDFLEGDYVEYGDIQDIRYIFEQLDPIKIVVIGGNHDPLTGNNPYKLVQWSSNVTILGPTVESVDFEDLHTSIVGFSWNSKGPMTFDYDKFELALEKVDQPIKIGLLHGDCYQDNGYLYMDPNRLEKFACDYIALGHIHKPSFIRSWIAYAGSLEPLDFSENYLHGYVEGTMELRKDNTTEIDINEKKDSMVITKKQFEFIPSMMQPTVQESIDISLYQSNLELFEAIIRFLLLKRYSHNTLVRINLEGQKTLQLEFNKERLIERLEQWKSQEAPNIAYIEISDKSTEGYDLEEVYNDHKNDIIGYFIRSMEGENDPAALRVGLSFLLGME